MLKFFGISKKEKVKVKRTADIFTVALNKVIDGGFPEIQDFFNNNNNLKKSPNITIADIKWFRLIIFMGNLQIMSTKFEDDETLDLRNHILDNLLPLLDDDNEIAMDLFLDYEEYFEDVTSKYPDNLKAISISIFDKYRINDCQSELFKRKDEPNPILFNELKNLLSHFMWDWDEFLENCKVVF